MLEGDRATSQHPLHSIPHTFQVQLFVYALGVGPPGLCCTYFSEVTLKEVMWDKLQLVSGPQLVLMISLLHHSLVLQLV